MNRRSCAKRLCSGSGLSPFGLFRGVAQQASGRRVALGPRVGPPLCPGQAGAGLCFLPQNFLGGPPNPAYLARGAVKKKMTKVTYICRSAKKKVVTYFILFLFYFYFLSIFFKGVFWAFRNKGSSKTRKNFSPKKSIWAHHKKCGFFFLRFFFFTLGCFVRFFFNRVFGRFVTRGVQKRDKKKSRENLLSFQKKYLLTYVTFFFFSRPTTGAFRLS
jgi:hypothetical protein